MSGPWIDCQTNQLAFSDEWVLAHYTEIKAAIHSLPSQRSVTRISLQGLQAIDTAGASLMVELLGPARVQEVDDWAPDLSAEQRALLKRVATAMVSPLEPEDTTPSRLVAALESLGRNVTGLWMQQRQLLGFIGLVLATLVWVLIRPRHWRITATVAQVQQTGLNAVPIVALLTFMVGAVVAFLGATVLSDFGATIYTVNLVAFAFLREFGVLLAAILLAGRTASAFTAQLGAMKSNEEIDALRAQGLNPVELLVLPRVLALLISLPLLTFVGMLCGLAGGAAVAVGTLDISLTQYLYTIERDIPLKHFLVGLGKAPLFAFVIAVIGCLEGFKVSGSAQSVGEHTTSSVVQSIFMVILLDALAALFFMEMGW
ncbi:ABC transporter permease [Halomonas sp. Bachu 37]|uniref:MlaE family ABC transporter permease n=1 Tax=Halomonas kashgarensis TaxID=3084920 RepID=UPI0032165988